MENEEWRPVAGYEGLYEVSDLGRVRSWHVFRNRPGPRILKPSRRRPKPYLQVTLSRANKNKTVKVHRLVMDAFVGPLPPGLETRHLDGDKSNNARRNLEYGTSSQNRHDQISHGTHPWLTSGRIALPIAG